MQLAGYAWKRSEGIKLKWILTEYNFRTSRRTLS